MIQKIFVFILLSFIWTQFASAEGTSDLGIDNNKIEQEIRELRQRKIDFEKHLKASAIDESSAIRSLKKEQREQERESEKARERYISEQKKNIGPDAEEREKIETAFQEKVDAMNEQKTKLYRQLRDREEKRISAAHVEIDENLEYDIHVPEKANRAKTKSNKPKAAFKSESF